MGHSELVRGGTHRAGASASEIPNKLYFRIGEVARLCEVPAYVLRFWESEFPQLKPNKGGTGQRLYRRRDVELALRVKTLLKDEGYTIPGARQTLKTELKQKEPQLTLIAGAAGGATLDAKSLSGLRRELELLSAMLAKPVSKAAKAQKPTSKSRSQPIAVENSVQPIHPSWTESALIESTLPPVESAPALVPTPAPLELAPIEPALLSVASMPAPLEPAPAKPLPALVPPARAPKTAPSAGLLFDLFDLPEKSEPQSSEGDER